MYNNPNYLTSTYPITSIKIYRGSLLYGQTNSSFYLCNVQNLVTIKSLILMIDNPKTYIPSTWKIVVMPNFNDYKLGDYF